METFLGIDFGTSGCRAILIDSENLIQQEISLQFPLASLDWLSIWQESLFALLGKISRSLRSTIRAIAINGTSSTVLLCDPHGRPLTEPLLYNDARGATILDQLSLFVPPNHLVLSGNSSLAKLIWWSKQPYFAEAAYFLHQADWLAFLLHGRLGISDYHNALKLGYDVLHLTYPHWLVNHPFYPLLPTVLAPGAAVGTVTPAIADQFHLSPNCVICTGTTDSIAAFLASGASQPGEAVTSLGSTLVLKLLSTDPVEDLASGIYSHRLGNLWLTGGASNTGGAVLKHFFTQDELAQYSQQINPDQPTALNYYPLLKSGDRFPINDPNLQPQLEPRPENPVEFLHGLLESLARIEALGYQKLQTLGASPLTQIFTAGGGAKNETWRKIRDRYLAVPVMVSRYTEAAYGTALLAKQGYGDDRIVNTAN
ncbi:MAG: FGGY-family carbohydrate kinase [Snowella sp.]|nr:FGGY-family carbohydrate kinase [Snowella sp.]